MIISLPMCPVGINHAYGFSYKANAVYKNRKIVEWEKECLKELLQYRNIRRSYPKNIIDFKLTFYFEKPMKQHNDIDGRLKFVLDMLQKAEYFEDDSFIKHIDLWKDFDKNKPRIEIMI